MQIFQPGFFSFCFRDRVHRLCDELDDTAGLLDLALGVLADVAGADDERDLGNAALAEDLAVAEGEEVENRRGVLGLAGEVLLALLKRDEGPELVEVDHRLPEVGLLLVEVSHTDLSEVTRVVLVQVGTVVVLTTGHTTTTWMLAVLSYTTVTGRDMTAVLAGLGESGRHFDCALSR